MPHARSLLIVVAAVLALLPSSAVGGGRHPGHVRDHGRSHGHHPVRDRHHLRDHHPVRDRMLDHHHPVRDRHHRPDDPHGRRHSHVDHHRKHHHGHKTGIVIGAHGLSVFVHHPHFFHKHHAHVSHKHHPRFVHTFGSRVIVTHPFFWSDPVIGSSPPIVTAPPVIVSPTPVVEADPQPPVSAAPPPLPTPTVIEHATGWYQLRGDGVTTPYVWVWIPKPPLSPPEAVPPAGPPRPPSEAPADPAPPRSSGSSAEFYCWTDEQGGVHWTDRRDAIPPNAQVCRPTGLGSPRIAPAPPWPRFRPPLVTPIAEYPADEIR